MGSPWQIMRHLFSFKLCFHILHSGHIIQHLVSSRAVILAFFSKSKWFLANRWYHFLSSTFCNISICKELACDWAVTTVSSSKFQGTVSPKLKTHSENLSSSFPLPHNPLSSVLHITTNMHNRKPNMNTFASDLWILCCIRDQSCSLLLSC